MYILGAGLAGCIAGILNGDAVILEKAKSADEIPAHKALLRFRSDKIARIAGVEFDKVVVRKSIWYDGKEYRQPTIRFANMYSRKVSNGYFERSILNLNDAERWIAPDNFHEILLQRCKHQIQYGSQVSYINENKITVDGSGLMYLDRAGSAVISTLPLPFVCKLLGIETELKFEQKPICVRRFRLANCNLYQTIYYPAPDFSVYRASIIRDNLIIEYFEDRSDAGEIDIIFNNFGINPADIISTAGRVSKQQGKISPVDDRMRKELIFKMSVERGVYSLGRFGVWRNILLDDVYEDVLQIRRMIGKTDYDNKLASMKGDSQ